MRRARKDSCERQNRIYSGSAPNCFSSASVWLAAASRDEFITIARRPVPGGRPVQTDRDAISFSDPLDVVHHGGLVSATSIAGGIGNHLVPRDIEPNYVRFIQQVFGERARRLGWHPQPGEDDDTRLLRAFVAPFVARNGEDAELSAESRRLAERWLEDRKAVDPNITGQVLQIAASGGDRALFDRFPAAAKATEDRRQRGYLLSALGSFRDPSIARAGLDVLLSGAFDMREALTLLYGPMRHTATRALPFEFVKANFDELVKRSPIDTGASFPYVGSAFCDERSRSEVEAFFTKRVENFNGGPRNLAQTLESIRLCEALVNAQQSSVAEFLRRY